MAFKFGNGAKVVTSDGKTGKVEFRDKGHNGHQDRYAVKTDDGQEIVYFEEELRKK